MAGATTMDPSQSPPNVGDAVEENVPWDKHESGMYRANVDIDHAEGAAEDAAMAGQEARDDLLLCEGYLKKIRGWGQNRTRWFRLTTNEFSFYSKDAGDLLAQCPHDNIASVSSKEGTRFEVRGLCLQKRRRVGCVCVCVCVWWWWWWWGGGKRRGP